MPRLKLLLLVVLIALGLRANELPWDNQWRFHLGDVPGAEAPDAKDGDWRSIDLPHDWSIEGRTNPTEPSAGGGGFFPTGIGWYRKTFHAPADWRGQRVEIEFDGVYRHSEAWINGHSLGQRPSGFVRFAYDLTPYLQPDGENVIAVRVDNSAQPNSRWYTGSGIYRHVRLRVSDRVDLAPDSFYATTTELAAGEAEVRFNAEVRNATNSAQEVALEIVLIDPAGRNAGVVRTTGTAAAGTTVPLTAHATVADYWPWSPNRVNSAQLVSRPSARISRPSSSSRITSTTIGRGPSRSTTRRMPFLSGAITPSRRM